MKKKKPTKKPTKKVKALKIKPSKKDKKQKIRPSKKVKNIVSVPINQLENLDQWLKIWNETKKLPHNRVVCSVCQIDFISLKGIGMAHAMKKFDGDMKRILTESVCKNCKPKPEVEKKDKVVQVLTREEMQARRDAISETLPKIDFYKTREPISLVKDKDACKAFTSFACHRPDIFLDYGCSECILQKNCACPIKDINRRPDDRRPKFKKAVFKPKN